MIKTILIIIGAGVVIYWLLSAMGFVPGYHCGSTMGPNGPVRWCEWSLGRTSG